MMEVLFKQGPLVRNRLGAIVFHRSAIPLPTLLTRPNAPKRKRCHTLVRANYGCRASPPWGRAGSLLGRRDDTSGVCRTVQYCARLKGPGQSPRLRLEELRVATRCARLLFR